MKKQWTAVAFGVGILLAGVSFIATSRYEDKELVQLGFTAALLVLFGIFLWWVLKRDKIPTHAVVTKEESSVELATK